MSIIGKRKETITKNNSISIIQGKRTISGIVINKEGYALTDYRLFIGSKEHPVKAVLSNSDTCDVHVVRYNKLRNIALVKIVNPTVPFANVTVNKGVEPLDKVKFWGVPGNTSLGGTYSEGSIAHVFKEYEQNYYLIDAMPHWGYTGAGIFSADGRLIGVSLLRSFDKRSNVVMPCLDINDIMNLLDLK